MVLLVLCAFSKKINLWFWPLKGVHSISTQSQIVNMSNSTASEFLLEAIELLKTAVFNSSI
jgi:hypothetical protein